jgi:ketosteroid isomerase-like protein
MSKFFVIFALLITFSGAVFAQKAVANKPAANTNSARAAIDVLRGKFVQAYNIQSADAVAELYTDDATYVGTAGDVITGKEQIRLGLKDELPFFRSFALVPLEFGSDNNLAYERGTFAARREIPDKEPQTLNGKYMIVYRRGKDNQWRIQMQMNSRDRAQK